MRKRYDFGSIEKGKHRHYFTGSERERGGIRAAACDFGRRHGMKFVCQYDQMSQRTTVQRIK